MKTKLLSTENTSLHPREDICPLNAEDICESEDGSGLILSLSTEVYGLTVVGTYVEDSENHEETKVAPTMSILNVETLKQKFIGRSESTILTIVGSIGVVEISPGESNKRLQECTAGLPGGWRDYGKFKRGAVNLPLSNSYARDMLANVNSARAPSMRPVSLDIP